MTVISLAKCKALLGITNTTYDTSLTAAIPYVDSAVKQITRNRWNYRILANIVEDSTEAAVSSIGDLYLNKYEDLEEYIMTGQQISGTGIPTDTYITDVDYNREDSTTDMVITITLSAAATATTSGLTAYLGIPIAYHKVIADACWWHSSHMSTNRTDDTWVSKTMGSVSVTRDKIDPKTGFPQWLTSAFPKYHGGH